MSELKQLEAIATALINMYEITAPPVPVETILQQPKDGMWEQVDLNQMSGTFLSVKDLYSPRMSLARLLARHVSNSYWGEERGLPDLIHNDEQKLRSFARMLIMPADLIEALSTAARNPTAMSLQFEVPEEDAKLRLSEFASGN
ncbi:MAG: hypothetical protein SF029_25165 [bacterium]|nr:hypothetical protein [bacterium]